VTDPTAVVPDDAPRWARDALDARSEAGTVDVAGCPIAYRRWGDPDRPGILLVHGGGAHLQWWSFLAPFLLPDHHVVALDLAGHGDSGRRADYDPEVWADELVGVADATGLDRPVLVGHSMGGFVSIVAAARHPDRWAGVVIVDSPVRRPDPESLELARRAPVPVPRVYPTPEDALARFRLIPDQPCENRWAVELIGRRSLRPTEGGWRWAFDPLIFDRIPRAIHEYLAQVRIRTCVIHGQLSAIVTPDVTDYMSELLGRSAPFVEIPQAHHHLLLDQPLAFVAALRAILADWEHSVPRRAPVA
jgi:pimeloyl-ACP methyl ester carboxylesterase